MTDVNGTPTGGRSEEEQDAGRGPVIRDKRRIDPETGAKRETAEQAGAKVKEGESGGAVSDAPPGDQAGGDQTGGSDKPHPDTLLAAERLEELRRKQAEFVNFRNRIRRERETDRARATGTVVEALLPVMDDIHSAREHGDLAEGSPFAAIADKLEQVLGRFGVQRTGQPGEVFDPTVHEALMHLPADTPGVELPEDATEMTIVQVMQPGFTVDGQVVRAARVAVADPS